MHYLIYKSAIQIHYLIYKSAIQCIIWYKYIIWFI